MVGVVQSGYVVGCNYSVFSFCCVNNIPQFTHLPLMNIWVVFSLGLFQKVLL